MVSYKVCKNRDREKRQVHLWSSLNLLFSPDGLSASRLLFHLLFSPLLPPFVSGTPWSLGDTTTVGRTYLCLFDRTQGPRHRRILHRPRIQEKLNVPRLPTVHVHGTCIQVGNGKDGSPGHRDTGTTGHRDNRTAEQRESRRGTCERAEQWSEERGEVGR